MCVGGGRGLGGDQFVVVDAVVVVVVVTATPAAMTEIRKVFSTHCAL